jgi:predicted phosphodiesterase
MRIAVVSDIHGNLTAFEAVLADLRQTAPDVIFHGGDLAQGGASPAEIVDRVRDLGWQGVLGNVDEMLFSPGSLTEFAGRSPHLKSLFAVIEEMATATCEALGEARLAWLSGLPRIQKHGPMALVHASPESTWVSPQDTAGDDELEAVYGPLGLPIAVYAHIHVPFIRRLPGMIVANTGSVSLSYDGDRRASYLLLDESGPEIRRVEYDVDKELKALSVCGLPHAEWIAQILNSASPHKPEVGSALESS